VLFLSVHQYPFYPGTGAPGDVGEGAGVGATINVGLPAGCGDGEYLAVFDRVFAPALARFAPDLILVSAGYDAAAADPLAAMLVSADGYRRLAARLIEIARAHAGGRIGAVLEGGYDLEGLADGVVALIEVMMGRAIDAGPDPVGRLADPAIAATLTAHRDIEGSPVRGPEPEGNESP
jgi:acetoin utilization deacetylase AcuC-like enzyme